MKKIRFTSPINLSASGKQRRFRINAYSGGTLVVSGFDHPVIVDLQGIDTSNSIPILIDHQSTVEATLGLTDRIVNDGRSLTLSGPVTGQSALSQQVLAQAASGHTWQASIGASVIEAEDIAAGQSVSVNGQRFVGPVIVARRSVLKETSVLPMGADSTTSVNLAAKAVALKGNGTMDFSQWLESLGIDETALTPEGVTLMQTQFDAMQSASADPAANPVASAAAIVNLRASAAAEQDRIGRVNQIAVAHPRIAAAAIRAGWSPEKTELEVLKATQNQRGGNVSNFIGNSGSGNGSPDQTQVLTASLAMNCGASPGFLAKSYGQNVVDAASRIEARGATFRTVMESTLRAAGMHSPSNRITDSFIRASFEASRKLEASGLTTMTLPGILSNAANKLLLEGYNMIKPTWKKFCAVGNLADFKEASRYRLAVGGEFEEVAGGKIKHLDLTNEQTYTNQLKTYASLVQLDRQSIINDDMQAFQTLPKTIGRMCIMKLEKETYSKLMANAGSFFHANNSNLLTGGGSVLAIAGLSAAEQKFLMATDDVGNPVMLTPEILLVPPTLSVTANQLVRDTQTVAVGIEATSELVPNGNPHAGRFEAVVSPWLENANLTGYSPAAWYLLARPQGTSGLIEVGFLNGQESPTIESGELNFDQLGISLRGYFDFGVAHQDHRFGVKNAGS